MGYVGGPIGIQTFVRGWEWNNNCFPSYTFKINCFRGHITSVGARNLISL